MDLLHILQILSLSITSGYIGNNIIKLEHTKNILKQIYNENIQVLDKVLNNEQISYILNIFSSSFS